MSITAKELAKQLGAFAVRCIHCFKQQARNQHRNTKENFRCGARKQLRLFKNRREKNNSRYNLFFNLY